MSHERLGEMLVRANLITPEQLNEALALQQTFGGRIGSSLINLGHINEKTIASFLGRQCGVPSVELSTVTIDPAVLKLVPVEVARKHLLIPLSQSGSLLTVAMVNPSDIRAINEVRSITGYYIQPMVAPETSIWNTLKKYEWLQQRQPPTKLLRESGL